MYYELLSGTLPFLGESPRDVGIKRTREEPRDLAAALPGADKRACAIVQRILKRDVGARYQSMGDLIRDLDRVLNGEPDSLGVIAAETEVPPQTRIKSVRTLAEKRWQEFNTTSAGSYCFSGCSFQGAAVAISKLRMVNPSEDEDQPPTEVSADPSEIITAIEQMLQKRKFGEVLFDVEPSALRVILLIPGQRRPALQSCVDLLTTLIESRVLDAHGVGIAWGKLWIGALGIAQMYSRSEIIKNSKLAGDTLRIAAKLSQNARRKELLILKEGTAGQSDLLEGVVIPQGYSLASRHTGGWSGIVPRRTFLRVMALRRG